LRFEFRNARWFFNGSAHAIYVIGIIISNNWFYEIGEKSGFLAKHCIGTLTGMDQNRSVFILSLPYYLYLASWVGKLLTNAGIPASLTTVRVTKLIPTHVCLVEIIVLQALFFFFFSFFLFLLFLAFSLRGALWGCIAALMSMVLLFDLFMVKSRPPTITFHDGYDEV
jgi:hypothetical protein